MEIREIIIFGFLLIVAIIIILEYRKKSQRIIELERFNAQLLEDCYSLERELKEESGCDDDEIKRIKNKFQPENIGGFSSGFTDWKKALFGN